MTLSGECCAGVDGISGDGRIGDNLHSPRLRGKEGRMIDSQIVKCPVCGREYRIFMFYAGDQSTCPTCRCVDVIEADSHYGGKYSTGTTTEAADE